VAEALAESLGVKGVVVCPAFPGAGRTIYQGHLFVADSLLHESGMQNHPITPMTDPDLRRWLSLQSRGSVGHVALPLVQAGGNVLRDSLLQRATRGHTFCVVDAMTDEDLLNLGNAIQEHVLITGGSGVAMGLPRNMHRKGLVAKSTNSNRSVSGPGAVLAGSCSETTRKQVEVHKERHPSFEIDISRVMAGEINAGTLTDFITEHPGTYPLVYSSVSPERVAMVQSRFGAQAVAERLDQLFANTAQKLLTRGYTRLVVAGGETSSAVAQTVSLALNEEEMRIGLEIDPGVPVLHIGKDKPIAMALKSGNFGADNFFTHAFEVMAGSISKNLGSVEQIK